MNNTVFQVGDELIVEKGREGMVNGRFWENTKKYWARGTNSKSRTTERRGTHKVFKSKQREILKAEKAKIKNNMNELIKAFEKMKIKNNNNSENNGKMEEETKGGARRTRRRKIVKKHGKTRGHRK